MRNVTSNEDSLADGSSLGGLRRSFVTLLGLAALVAGSISCGDVVRDSRSPVFLVIDVLTGSRGAVTPGTGTTILISDVITNVIAPAPCSAASPCPTIFGDTGSVTLRAPLKDVTGLAPTTNNEVTITRYHVEYTRADGRNTPGVDVPYPFDGAATGTITAGGSLTLGFELVRNVAKQESPLAQLRTSPNIITSIARVTFYGQDRVGNNVSVTGQIQIDFGNFGDF
jgi:hypothetical protein